VLPKHYFLHACCQIWPRSTSSLRLRNFAGSLHIFSAAISHLYYCTCDSGFPASHPRDFVSSLLLLCGLSPSLHFVPGLPVPCTQSFPAGAVIRPQDISSSALSIVQNLICASL
jgi:hypothetical protein